jgi:predicted Zn-dependent protease
VQSSKVLIFLVFVVLNFSGCQSIGSLNYSISKEVFKSSDKKDYDSLAKESLYILYALEYENSKNYEKALQNYLRLYTINSSDYGYVTKIIELALKTRNIDIAKEYLDISRFEFHKPLNRVLAAIYLEEGNYRLGLELLDAEYKKSKDRLLLLDIASILTSLNMEKEAISLLENHLLLYEYDKELSNRLLLLLTNRLNNNIKDSFDNVYRIVNMLEKLYLSSNNLSYLEDAINILIGIKDKKSAITLLYKYRLYDELLLDLLKESGNFVDASKLANELYQKSNNNNFLALEAIYLYESLEKKDSKTLKKIYTKLKKALKDVNNSLYENYLGYMLIEHDIDYKEGIKYVKKALKSNPNSNYYLDSLAWGYYKTNRCKEALTLIDKIMKNSFSDDILFEKEFNYHIEMINSKCKGR